MAITLTATCPIDDLPMGTVSASLSPDARVRTEGKRIGKHLHLVFAGVLICPNGHRWVVGPGATLERTR